MKISRIAPLATALTLAGLVSSAWAADSIKIALAGPVTGSVAQYGDMQRTGAQVAIDQINKAGGINGKKLEAVVYDDACDPKQAVAVANKIVNDDIDFVIGHVCSGAAEAASNIYEDEGVLMMSASATAPNITARGFKNIFRVIGLDSVQGPVASKYILANYKGKKIAILHDKQQYGEGLASTVKKALDAAGSKPVLYEGINSGDKDFNAIITKLKRVGTEFVYFGGYHPEFALLMRQARQAGLKVQFMGPEGVGNKEVLAIAGDASEGMLTTLPRAFELDPKNKAVVDMVKAKKKDPSATFVIPYYAAVQTLAAGIKKAGSTDTAKVAAALRANTFDTAIGNIGFDAKGDVKNFTYVVYVWRKDGTKTEAK